MRRLIFGHFWYEISNGDHGESNELSTELGRFNLKRGMRIANFSVQQGKCMPPLTHEIAY